MRIGLAIAFSLFATFAWAQAPEATGAETASSVSSAAPAPPEIPRTPVPPQETPAPTSAPSLTATAEPLPAPGTGAPSEQTTPSESPAPPTPQSPDASPWTKSLTGTPLKLNAGAPTPEAKSFAETPRVETAPTPALGPEIAFEVVAIKAVRGAKGAVQIDPALLGLRDALSGLRGFSGFTRLAAGGMRAPVQGEGRFRINDVYTLVTTPLSADDGRVRVHARVCQQGDAALGHGPRDVLATTSVLTPSGQLLLGGAPLDDGQLAIIITLAR